MLTADFVTYKADSLKQKTSEKRLQGENPIQYQIADDTNIKHVPMGNDESRSNWILTEYFAQAVLKNNANTQTLVFTSASRRTRRIHMQFE